MPAVSGVVRDAVDSCLRKPARPPPSHFHPAPFLPTAALDDGVVLVSCTDGELDTAGRLHALNATSGAPLWEFDAMDNGTSYGLHYVPAVDNTR